MGWEDLPQTELDFDHFDTVVKYVEVTKRVLEEDIVKGKLSESHWNGLERGEKGRSPFGTFAEGNELMGKAIAARKAVTARANALAKELAYMVDTLNKTKEAFHNVEELNRADIDGKSAQLPTFSGSTANPQNPYSNH